MPSAYFGPCSGEHDTAAVHEAAQERPWFRGMLPDAADTGWQGHDAARVPQQNKPHSFNTDNVHYVILAGATLSRDTLQDLGVSPGRHPATTTTPEPSTA